MRSSGAVPAAGTDAKRGLKKADIPNKIPQTRVERPVLAPALIPAADSGLIRIGGPERQPLAIEASPHTIKSHRPLGIAPFDFVRFARSILSALTTVNCSI